jgi:hypothetical protein
MLAIGKEAQKLLTNGGAAEDGRGDGHGLMGNYALVNVFIFAFHGLGRLFVVDSCIVLRLKKHITMLDLSSYSLLI